jgi:hypothetical protein
MATLINGRNVNKVPGTFWLRQALVSRSRRLSDNSDDSDSVFATSDEQMHLLVVSMMPVFRMFSQVIQHVQIRTFYSKVVHICN